jgi:hypothetical protein
VAKKKKKWIKKAIKSPGSFTRWCKSRGHKGVTAACIAEGKRSKSATTRKRAHLAETLRGMSRKKGKK